MKTTTVTSHPPKTLKYYDKSQHLSEKRKSNAFKSPSLQKKLYYERSQQKCASKKKTRRGPNKSPAKQARDRKRSDFFAMERLRLICEDLRQRRFRREEMVHPSTPESRTSSPPSDINPEKDNDPGEDHPEMTFLYRLLCCIVIVFCFMIVSELHL